MNYSNNINAILVILAWQWADNLMNTWDFGDYFKDRGTPLTDADEGRFAQTKDPFDMHRFSANLAQCRAYCTIFP